MTALDAQPDLTLAQCCDRWKVKSRNAIKARAKALRVELVPISSTCTIWPGEHVALGDELAEYLKDRGKLADFPHRLPAPADSSDNTEARPLTAPADSSDGRRQAALTAPAGSSDAMAAFGALLATMRQEPAGDPLAVPRALAEAADAGHWLSNAELAAVLGMSRSTVAHWSEGHCPRPGFRLERRKESGSVWWKVSRQ